MYELSYSLNFDPDQIEVKSIPPKLLRKLSEWHRGLLRLELAAKWRCPNDEPGDDAEVLEVRALTDDDMLVASDTPTFSPKQIAEHVTYVALEAVRHLIKTQDLAPDSAVQFRLTAFVVTIDASGQPRQTAKNAKFSLGETDVDAEDEDNEDEDEDESEEDEESEESDGEEDEEDPEEAAEEEAEEEKPSKKRAPPKTSRQRSRERKQLGFHQREERVRSRERDFDIRERNSDRRMGMGYSIAERLRGRFDPETHVQQQSRPPRAVSRQSESEIIDLWRQQNAMQQQQLDAIAADRQEIKTERQQLIDNYRVMFDDLRRNYGILHDVDMETVREANAAAKVNTRTTSETMEHQRALVGEGWSMLRQGVTMQQQAMSAMAGREKEILQIRAEHTESDLRAQLAAKDEKSANPPKSKLEEIKDLLVEVLEVAGPFIGAVKAGAAGDTEAELEGLTETMTRIDKRRGGRPVPMTTPINDQDPPPSKPAPTPSVLPRKPPRPPQQDQPPTPKPAIVDVPTSEPPIDAVALPKGFKTFESFEAKFPVVARLRLLIGWLTPTQVSKIEATIGGAWPKIVRAAAADSDRAAIMGMMSVRSKLKNPQAEKMLRETLITDQIALLEDIGTTIKKRFS